jgi:hypothetical protein
VANGDGCGCAGRVVDGHAFNRFSGRNKLNFSLFTLPKKGDIRRFVQTAGLTSRPKTR